MEIMDTTPAPPVALAKIPSLTKPPSIKVLKPAGKVTSRAARKPRTSRFMSKHERLMEKRNEERLSKYKVTKETWCKFSNIDMKKQIRQLIHIIILKLIVICQFM